MHSNTTVILLYIISGIRKQGDKTDTQRILSHTVSNEGSANWCTAARDGESILQKIVESVRK